jgi:hypothetical protein
MNRDGSYKAESFRDQVGIAVTPLHRDRVMAQLGIGRRTWERHVSDWVDSRMAHRCRPGFVFVFLTPSATCPRCGGPTPHVADGRQDVTRRATPHDAESSLNEGLHLGDARGDGPSARQPRPGVDFDPETGEVFEEEPPENEVAEARAEFEGRRDVREWTTD